jgi:predicted O-methyltransferase YrrM
MLKRCIKGTAYFLAPRWAAAVDNRYWAAKQARQLARRCSQPGRLEDVLDAVLASPEFRPDQRRAEILDLLELLRRDPPRRLCEIGARRGGTLILFGQAAAPDGRILSLDIDFRAFQLKWNPRFARVGQQVTCLRGDSHAPETLARAREWLRGELLDFLFIDGDHSLEGVRSDFTMYAPLVRHGGVIAFHDIAPDFKTRHGIITSSDVGDVPTFWAELKRRGYAAEELIEHPEQDGMGIGVIRWQGFRNS